MRVRYGLSIALALIGLRPVAAQLQTVNLQAEDKLEAVAITLTRRGPYPAEIERAAGPFLLFIVNRSGVLEDKYSLVKVGAEDAAAGELPSLLDFHSTLVRQRDHQVINPLPGEYELRFASRPEWKVKIRIGGN